MHAKLNLPKHFHWRAILLRFLVNAVTIFIVVVLTPQVYFVNPTILHLLLMALVLGILNAILKPIIQFFMLPFIFISYGLIIILINGLMAWLLARIFPEALVVSNLFWALVAGTLYGIISSFLESLFGLNEPIIPDDSAEDLALRERLDAESGDIVKASVDHRKAKTQNAADLANVITDEKDEKLDRAQDSTLDAVTAVEAVEAIGGVEPQVPPTEGETAEEEAESVANEVDDKDDAASDKATVEIARTEPQTLSADEKSEFQEVEKEIQEDEEES